MDTWQRQLSYIVHQLVAYLADADERLLNGRINELILKNQRLGGPEGGFLFGGRFFCTETSPAIRNQIPKQMAHSELHAEIRVLMADQVQYEEETRRIHHGIHLVLRPCKNLQDVRDALPDMLAQVVPEVQNLNRTRPAGWTLTEDPLKAHEWPALAELFDFYVANRMLY